MADILEFTYEISDDDFTRAGEASSDFKKKLKKLGVSPDVIRRVSIALYEGEINMVIHANGGVAEVLVSEDAVEIILKDQGPGIPNVEQAMQEGFSTAPSSIQSLGFGAGMGLPNMKRYTDTLEIETEVGVGTTITMTVLVS